MAKIYEHVELAPDPLLGHIDENGQIYYDEGGQSEILGRIDYEKGQVYDEDDVYMGWIEENGEIYGSYEDGDLRLGRVADDGKLYVYDEDEAELYVGQVTEMKQKADGAAAVLFFFDEYEEYYEEEDDDEEEK